MTSDKMVRLRRRFLLRYEELKSRLTHRLGSPELAGEALQDTWLRLQNTNTATNVNYADAYLLRIAVNLATDRRRADARRLRRDEVDELLNIADDNPDPERVAESRSDLRLLKDILLELPPRQRAILLAARLDEMSRQDIAKRFGISVRLVQRELQEAQDYCAARLKRGGHPFKRSSSQASLKVDKARVDDEKMPPDEDR